MNDEIRLTQSLHSTFVHQFQGFLQTVYRYLQENDVDAVHYNEYYSQYRELVSSIYRIHDYREIYKYIEKPIGVKKPNPFKYALKILGEYEGISIILKKPIFRRYKKTRREIVYELTLNEALNRSNIILNYLNTIVIKSDQF